MNIIIRVDGSTQIGTGHVMRCLTLAGALRKHGANVEFISRRQAGDLCDYIEQSGFKVSRLSGSGSFDQMTDREQCAGLLAARKDNIDWLIVDHYGIDRQWEQPMGSHVRDIAVIDDLADRPHACGLLLNQSDYKADRNRYLGLVPTDCRLLLGLRYALLRSEFADARSKLKVRTGLIKRIFVFFGGSDPANETGKVLAAIKELGRSDLAIDVVVGATNPHKEVIKDICVGLPNATYHCQICNMAEVMAAADLAIGAGGSTMLERFCLALPGVVICIADNQREFANSLANAGKILCLGDSGQVSAQDINSTVSALLANPPLVRFLADAGSTLVDGKGADRVALYLCKPDIELRRAGTEDCENLYKWRNSEVTRRYSFAANEVGWQEHVQWFGASLADPNRVLLIGEHKDEAVGVLRYDIERSEARISIYLAPDKHGKGYGAILLGAGEQWLRENRPDTRTQVAEILPSNHTSIKTFLDVGFVQHHSVYKKVL